MLMLLVSCSRGTWADGDAVQDASSHSALPNDDSLSAGLLVKNELRCLGLLLSYLIILSHLVLA